MVVHHLLGQAIRPNSIYKFKGREARFSHKVVAIERDRSTPGADDINRFANARIPWHPPDHEYVEGIDVGQAVCKFIPANPLSPPTIRLSRVNIVDYTVKVSGCVGLSGYEQDARAVGRDRSRDQVP